MDYTIKQLADLAGVSRRTLRYYDKIGLLKPSSRGRNRYRYYDKDAMLRLQQILFYKELGLSLDEIKDILDQPDFDVFRALQSHRRSLKKRIQRLERLMDTVDKTMEHLTGGTRMNEKQVFEAFSEQQQEEYTHEARQRWNPDVVDQSMNLWKSYSPEKKQQILDEGKAVYVNIQTHMEAGQAPGGSAVQECLARWHEHMRYFYKPTIDMLRGLGQLYVTDPRFRANFEAMHPDLPDYLNQAIQIYCDTKG